MDAQQVKSSHVAERSRAHHSGQEFLMAGLVVLVGIVSMVACARRGARECGIQAVRERQFDPPLILAGSYEMIQGQLVLRDIVPESNVIYRIEVVMSGSNKASGYVLCDFVAVTYGWNPPESYLKVPSARLTTAPAAYQHTFTCPAAPPFADVRVLNYSQSIVNIHAVRLVDVVVHPCERTNARRWTVWSVTSILLGPGAVAGLLVWRVLARCLAVIRANDVSGAHELAGLVAAASVACVSGAALLWIALHSHGWDWYIAETYAYVAYTALRHYHEFPYFSYLINGGTYLIQYPQSPLLLLFSVWVWLLGPEGGARFRWFVFGGVGLAGMVWWLRPHIGRQAALVAGVAYVLSCGTLWRVVVGNDMFMWHLTVPLVCWAIEKVVLEQRVRHACVCGLLAGVILLGPTLHSLLYLLVPVACVWAVLCMSAVWPERRALVRASLLLALAAGIGMLIALPKIVAWQAFDMRRGVECDPVLYPWSALRELAVWQTQVAGVLLNGAPRLWFGSVRAPAYGNFESNVALTPVMWAMAVVGLLAGWRTRDTRRRLYLLALILVVAGYVLAVNFTAWHAFWSISKSFRVPGRFLGLAGFGGAVLAGLGTQLILECFPRRWPQLACTVVMVLSTLGFAMHWAYRASGGAQGTSRACRLVAHPRDMAGCITQFCGSATPRDLLHYADPTSFRITGNCFKPFFAETIGISNAATRTRAPLFALPPGARAHATHTRIELFDIPPRSSVLINLRTSSLGTACEVWPPAPYLVTTRWVNHCLLMRFDSVSDTRIVHAIIRPAAPVPRLAWLVPLVVSMACGVYLLISHAPRLHEPS